MVRFFGIGGGKGGDASKNLPAQARALQVEAKTFFEAVEKEKHTFEYEEKILRDFINKLTLLMEQLALQFKAMAGFGEGRDIPESYNVDTLGINNYQTLNKLFGEFESMLRAVGGHIEHFNRADFDYLLEVENIIRRAYQGHGHDKIPQSFLEAVTAQALNDIIWIDLQLKELKKLYSHEEKWIDTEESIVEKCMKMIGKLRVERDVALVHRDSIQAVRTSLAGSDYHAYFQIEGVDHDVKRLLGYVNVVKRLEDDIQNITKQFGVLGDKIEHIINLIYQRFVRIYRSHQRLIELLTRLRGMQEVNIDTSRLIETVNSIYTTYGSLSSRPYFGLDLPHIRQESIPLIINSYNADVVKFRALLERKLNLLPVIDRKMREGFNELHGMIDANKAMSSLSGDEKRLLEELIGGTNEFEKELRDIIKK